MWNHSRPHPFGWVKYGGLILLAAAGVGGGLYLAGGPSQEGKPAPALPNVDAPTHRYPQTSADAKDTLEAPVLAADAAGRVYAAWASKTGDNERTLYLARSDDGGRGFDPPRAVARSGIFKSVAEMKGKAVTRELRMVPHLAAAGGAIHLAWTESLPGLAGVRMVVAASTDRGETFGTPVPVHQGGGARATFTALTAAPDGTLLGSWLDNRSKAQQCFAAIREAGQPLFEPEQVVHTGDDEKGVCPCCPTAGLLGADGTAYVAFRNVADGYRDIVIGVKRPSATAYDRHRIVPPTWTFNGCPHDGASLARVGETLHVVWMDAHTGSPRCYHASAKLADMKFTAHELHAIPSGTQGNAKLYADAAGTLHAVWEESVGAEPPPGGAHRHEPAAPQPGSGGGRAVMYRSLRAGAPEFGEARTVVAKPGAYQTRPAITGTPDGNLLVAWNELDETGKSVVVTRLGDRGGKK